MKNSFNFNQLFILEMANNHQGDLEHGLKIINTYGELAKKLGVRCAIKFQFRQLESFIHPDYHTRTDVKHIPRFVGTKLDLEQYKILRDAVLTQGMVTMCTPFDEESVPKILELDLDIIKIGSCSAGDWPLLEKVAETGKPLVISTAGLSQSQIDRLVSFFQYRRCDFALMHCVAIYPTPPEKLRLSQIENLRLRYPEVPIGFSTHEDPNYFDAVRVAVAKGAKLFERHVDIPSPKYKMNAYSSAPEQIEKWIKAYLETIESCGGEHRAPAFPEELESLKTLMRGVYSKKPIKKGQEIKREDVFFAMPIQEGQLFSGNWHKGMIADNDYGEGTPINEQLASFYVSKETQIYQILLQVQGMLNQARIRMGKESSIEISHHYGLEAFREFGAVLIGIINRAYCKKLVIQLPRQKHPYHFHKNKEETFQLLYGDLEVEIDGKQYSLQPGDTLLIEPKKWHKFHTLHGAIFEEISTTDLPNDSVYEDEKINAQPKSSRKTQIPNWESSVKSALLHE